MNLLRFLLAFYFMALLLVPCEDVHKNSGSENMTFSYSLQDSHSENSGDICSPLCICNCCQITAAVFKVDVLDIQNEIHSYFSTKILFGKNNFAYQVYDHIWQPPKI